MERPASSQMKSWLYREEVNIAHTSRMLNKYKETQTTNMIITGSGIVSNRSDMAKLWKLRDIEALKLIEQWKNNPKEIDDKTVVDLDMQHYDFVKRLMNDKTNLQERLKNPEIYSAYQYQPYFHRPETMIFTNSQECILFVRSDYDGYRERIVPIIWELNDSHSLSILAGMAADDKSEKVRNKAAETWMALLMPEGSTNDQKAWLDNFIKSEKMQGKDGKKWAIEAAERILRKMAKEQPASNAPPKQVLGSNLISAIGN
ncbi:MAG: hypothetical protein KJ919_09570 [Verrucomicrobia bacterium]|nr:hypothetical protein [Verrucomicrobiota bacterium]